MSYVMSGGLLGRIRQRRPPAGASRLAEPGARAGQRPEPALDWRAVQEVLEPVRPRWDLAILCNLDEQIPRRTADLLTAINTQTRSRPQAAPERRVRAEPREHIDRRRHRKLSPQVLSERVRSLEGRGYIRHQDLSRLPIVRVYILLPKGRRLIEVLSGLSLEAERGYGGMTGGSRR
jgi:DNA-binding HxlR family transcriptional regulator